MNLYYLKQKDNTQNYTYNSCVVCAENEEEAKKMHPNIDVKWTMDMWYHTQLEMPYESALRHSGMDWAHSPNSVTAICIGKASSEFTKPAIIISSCNCK